jgi:signal transduction histidine kinase/DNA-binding response OmpR family regulator/CHASE3 domain sensor protein
MEKFKRNLLIGFGASLLILLVSSVLSFVSIRNLLKSARLVNHTNNVIQQLNEINTALIDAETGQRGFLLSGSEVFLEPYIDARDRVHSAYERVSELTSENPQQQKSLAELEAATEVRLNTLKDNLDLKIQGKVIPADRLEVGRTQMQEVRRLIKQLITREQELLQERTVTMNRLAAFTPALVIIASMIALFITVVFFSRVRNDFEERLKLQNQLMAKDQEISNRITIIDGIAEKISSGHYEVRVNDAESDSLGSLAASLNEMATSLHHSFSLLTDKEWLQSGLANLSEILVGEKNVKELATDSLEYVANYTQSNVGAFYFIDHQEAVLLSGFAFSGQTGEIKSLENGIVGQAAKSKKVIQVSGIPQENIIISYATGNAKSTNVIAIPLMDGMNVRGVIELGSVRKFTERELDFLKQAAPGIGIALTVAENRRRLQELLDETQSQSEELRTQHTELENLNSELEVQAEKLQASEEELRVQQEELKHANQELEERSRLLEDKNQLISERNADIQKKANELAKSARYKSEFLANMSHELRTPLNSILLLSRLMSENTSKNLTTDQIDYAKVIQSSGNGLLSLIDEILDLSKIEAGKMQLEYQEFSLQQFVQDLRNMFNPITNEKGIDFITEINPGVPVTLETDKLRLEQIIRNLVSNAIKFTSKGFIKLTVQQGKEGFIQFKVIDSGIGIPKDKHSLVFEAFQQADGSTRRKFGGTGLGLSISRELAKLLGGDIQLKSVVDEGSEFTLEIPVSKIASNENGHTNVIDKENDGALVVPKEPDEVLPDLKTKKYISTIIPQNIGDDRNSIQEGDKVMLVVEDDINFAKSLLDYTRMKGYKCVVAVRGDEGIDLARTILPLGILLDIELPVKSGWEVMAELKGDPKTRHIPVHIMSSHEVKAESLMKGAVDFINKPVAFEKIQTIFQKLEYVLTHHPKKVLIIEENPQHAKALAYFLESFDIVLEINNDLQSAIQSLKDDKIDCVIVDMDQRVYDGLEELRKTPGLETLPIIIFTGNTLSQAEQVRLKKYADSIVVKTAHSYKRILDEVSLFLHLVEKNEPNESPAKRFGKLGTMEEVLQNKTVLIADDDMRNVFSLTKTLEKFKMKIVPAVDGKDALNQLEKHKNVDIVLMDMMMPELDGYEAISAMRKNRKWKDLPIIAVTAKAMMGDREKCIKAGASDYITKPVDIDQLISLLRVWLYDNRS